MTQYRTAQGKTIDMASFTAQHEMVRAVGNMGVNARGDKIDSSGRIVQTVNDKLDEYYSGTVHNPGATSISGIPSGPVESRPKPQPRKSQNAVTQPEPVSPTVTAVSLEELSSVERELHETLEQDLERELAVENTKSSRNKK